MRRGDVVLVEFDPATGHEAAKTRPAVVVSNDAANRTADHDDRAVVTVVPITSTVRHVLSFQVLLAPGSSGLGSPSKAQTELVRSVAASRVARSIGVVDAETMRSLDDALRLHLAL